MAESRDGVPHVCADQDCGEYDCPGCERSVPNCFGAGDELGELCDDCAVVVWHMREDAAAERGVFA